LILSLRMAPTKDSTITSDKTVKGEPVKSVIANPTFVVPVNNWLTKYYALAQTDLGRLAVRSASSRRHWPNENCVLWPPTTCFLGDKDEEAVESETLDLS